MTGKTKELLLELKEVGYEKVAIFVHDKRIPISVQVREGSTGRKIDDDGIQDDGKFYPKRLFQGTHWGHGTDMCPFRVISATPKQLDNESWPKIWGIVRKLNFSDGNGSGDSIAITPNRVKLLTAGYYDLKNI